MRTINFAKRNFKEIVRDPISLIFTIVLPIFLLFIFQQFKIPDEIYKIENFTPGIILFGFTFVTLFTSTLIAKDRSTSLLIRLGVSPMKPMEYILGYALSVIPIVLIQNILFFTTALLLGLTFNINIILTMLVSIPVSLLFIALGILVGCIANEKSASGISSVIVQFVVFTSGMYFSTEMVGKTFGFICNALPFSSSLNIIKSVLNNSYDNILKYILIFLGYTIVISIISILTFKNKMTSDNK